MYEGKSHTLFFRYAVPQMMGLLFNSVYTIVDGVFIGNRLGREAMAAAAVAVPLVEILISMALAVASGAGVLITVRLECHEEKRARRIFDNAVVMLGFTGFLVAVLGNIFLCPLASLLGATPDVLPMAAAYLRYIVTFAPFQLFSFLLGGMVRNDGRPRLAMTAMILGAVSNIVLDYVFMYPMNMGIEGAALATALGPIFSVLILLPHFVRKRGRLYFTKSRFALSDTGQILGCGFPAFIMEFSIGIITFIYNQAITRCGYGEMGLAAYLLIGYLMLIVLTLFLGMAEGLQPVFSYLVASGDKKRCQAMHRFSVGAFVLVGVASYGLILLFSRHFYGIFTADDLVLADFAATRSSAYFWGYVFAGVNILMVSYWQSAQKARRALTVSLLRSLILPPVLTFCLPVLLGRETLWFCQSLADALTAGCVAAMLFFSRRETMRTESGTDSVH